MEHTWLVKIMKEKGYSRELLSQETGIGYQRICEYVTGTRRPRPERAMLIADKLGFDWTLFYKVS